MEKLANEWIDFNITDNTKKREIPILTISAYNTLFKFNNAFTVREMEINGEINKKSALLGYSKSKNAIGIRFVERPIGNNSFRLRIVFNRFHTPSYLYISVASFFTQNNIDINKYKGDYLPVLETINGNDFWVVYLKENHQ